MTDEYPLALPEPDQLPAAEWTPHHGVQPDWVMEAHRSYDRHSTHMNHLVKSVREFTHGGHEVKITTTYKIEVDGQTRHLHLAVSEDGRLMCHSTPYEEYTSAVDVIRTLIDRFPHAFEAERKAS